MKAGVKFFQYHKPMFDSGYYRMELKEAAEIKNNNSAATPIVNYSSDVNFVMTAKRFKLEEHELYSVYPPSGSSGRYGNCLPHMVLNRSTVPWEYLLEERGEEAPAPGLALLVFSEEEKVKPETVRIKDIGLNLPERGYLSPFLKLTDTDADKEDDECQIVDIPGKLFAQICPTKRELSLLCHVREVKLTDKVADPQVMDGNFAVITANRYPREPGEGEGPVEHNACLVSLKEYPQFLDSETKRKEAEAYSVIRLICLAGFSFSTAKETSDFVGIMKQIRPGVLCRTVPESVRDERLKDILKRGYYPMDHNLRDGSKTVSWYRGPLLPFEETVVSPRYHVFSDSHYKLDKETGILDVSYGCAWQLGRMFALENLSTCRELLEWRYKNYKEAAKNEQIRQVMDHLSYGKSVPEKSLKEELKVILEEAVKAIPVYEEQEDG